MTSKFKVAIATLLAALVALTVAATATAHVSAQPPDQTAGSFTKITFRVPNERDVDVQKLEISFPDTLDHVAVMPTPGWDYEIKKEKLDEPRKAAEGDGEVTEYISTITWTGGAIKAGEFQEFSVSMKLPEEGELGNLLFFPALQTYKGGEVSKWTQKPKTADEDRHELDDPAPAIEMAAASEDAHGSKMEDEKADSDEGSTVNLSSYAKDNHVHKHFTVVWALLALSILLGLLAFIRGGRKKS